MTADEILENLNEDQIKAAKSIYGPYFILAGPGAGKTRVVVARTQYMIAIENIDPQNILLFTFTNKAANELKERIKNKIGDNADKITVGTYHSVCSRILRQYCDRIGYRKKFTIYDTEDSEAVIKRIIKQYKTEIHLSNVCSYISDQKNSLVRPSVALINAKNSTERLYAEIYQKYQTELINQNSMDFDDLIVNTIYLLENNLDVLENVNKKYRFIVADESHDSNPRDLKLIELLAGDNKNICLILDDDQSIYSFRGVKIDSVINFNKVFPELRTIVLHKNYRSSQTIVNASRSLIANNSLQLRKDLFTDNPQGVPIVYYEEYNQRTEAMRVAGLIKALNKKLNLSYKDMAILYRMTHQSRNLEEHLLKEGIPYKIVGGLPFYGRKEIKDVLSYIRFVINPYDFEAFKRLVGAPKRGIGDSTLEKILNFSRTKYSKPIDLYRACNEIKIKGKATAKHVSDLAGQLKVLFDNIDLCPSDFIKLVLSTTKYDEYVNEETNKEARIDRMSNLIELQTIAAEFDNIEEFLQNTSLDSQINDEDTECISLMTMHASKGLEYEVVIIVDAYEGINPHFKATTKQEIEEERRLFYVAMTRAKNYLFFVRPKHVVQYGRPCSTKESRFIREIDSKYIKKC